ncbi:MAG: hypothetical protein A2Y07_11180 [Planctomycetes bacterium GWF2_50_10]|nr:MAG: hypothetical protein A2Y07_11180 [Planctomycetes bacterium GWF2_50_10]
MNWRPVFNGTPQLKQFYCYGGSILAAGSTPKQIGSGAAEKSYIHPVAVVNLAGSDGAILRGTNSVVVNYGGEFMMPSNTQQTW